MPETFSPLVWHNDTVPAINETNLNRIELGIEALDDRVASVELGVCPVVVVPFATSVTLNATQGGLFRCVASADLTLDDIVGGIDGQTVVFEVQASGGARTLHFTGSTNTVDITAGQWWVGVFRYVAADSAWLLDDGSSDGNSGSTSNLNVLAPQTLPYASTITPNAAAGALFRITAPGNFTLANPINGTDGQAVVVEVLASGGSRTVTFAAGYPAVTIPSGTKWAGTLRYTATTNDWMLATVSSPASAVYSVNSLTGTVALTADNIPDGSTKVTMTAAERTKLTGLGGSGGGGGGAVVLNATDTIPTGLPDGTVVLRRAGTTTSTATGLMSTLTDNFTTSDTTKWTFETGAVVTGGRLVITPSAAYPTATSVNSYNLTGSYLHAQVPVRTNTGNGTIVSNFGVLAASGLNRIYFEYDGFGLDARYDVGGVGSSVTYVTFNATNHAWWRVREASGTIYWEVSTNGTSWSAFTSLSAPFAVTSVKAYALAGFYGTEPTPGTFAIDNVNS